VRKRVARTSDPACGFVSFAWLPVHFAGTPAIFQIDFFSESSTSAVPPSSALYGAQRSNSGQTRMPMFYALPRVRCRRPLMRAEALAARTASGPEHRRFGQPRRHPLILHRPQPGSVGHLVSGPSSLMAVAPSPTALRRREPGRANRPRLFPSQPRRLVFGGRKNRRNEWPAFHTAALPGPPPMVEGQTACFIESAPR